MAIPAQFDQAYSSSEALAAVETGFRAEGGQQVAGKWGFIDTTGKFVISPRFELTLKFSEGLARASENLGAWGFIDRTRRFVIARNYSEAWDFSEGLAPVWPDSDGGGFVYIDRTGKKIVKPKGGRWAFSDGLTVAGEYGKRVYVDRTADAKRVVHASLSEEAKALPGLAIVPGGVERGRCMHFDVLWSNPGTGSAHVAFYTVDLRSTALWTGVTGTCHLVSSRLM